MMDVRGKVALITGGASGFGRRLAERLVQKGARVVLMDLDAEQGKQTVSELGGDRNAVFSRGDVRNVQDWKAAFERATTAFGPIHIVVNNAGIPEQVPFREDHANAPGKEEWRRVLDINVVALVYGTQLALKHFADHHQGGVIVNVASSAGLYPFQKGPVYSASKHAVVGLTMSLKEDARAVHARVNAVAPFFSLTRLVEKKRDEDPSFAAMLSRLTLVPIDTVVEAMLQCIEDPSLESAVLAVNPNGIERVFPRKANY